MSKKRLLAILGSPHHNGATGSLLNYILKEAKKKGWDINKVNLYEKEIAYCRGCRRCLSTKECIQKDDIGEIAELLKECDFVILAAPTYWANVPAIVKNMFDRLLGVVMEETGQFPKPRLSSQQKYFLITACNTPFPFSFLCGQSRGTIRAMKEFFKTAGLSYLGKIVLTNYKGNLKISQKLKNKVKKILEE